MSKLKEAIEYKSKSQREDYLEYLLENGIDNKDKSEIVAIILSYFPTHNDWTLVLLIDLTNDEQIISKDLLNIYLSGLLESKTYYIKLSILDYIGATKDLYKEAKIDIDFSLVEELAYSKKNKLVVRNTALLTLIEAYFSTKSEQILQLKQNLKKTTDHRTHIRLYNSLLGTELYKVLPQKEILDFIRISRTMNLGRGLDITIKEFELKLQKLSQ